MSLTLPRWDELHAQEGVSPVLLHPYLLHQHKPIDSGSTFLTKCLKRSMKNPQKVLGDLQFQAAMESVTRSSFRAEVQETFCRASSLLCGVAAHDGDTSLSPEI